MDPTRILTLLLRLIGTILALATLAIVMPESWMAASHRWLGLGDFPEAPLTSYLARSAAALYAMRGGLFFLAATDLDRYSGLIRYLAAADVVFGLVVLGIDWTAGMPLYWTLLEGPPIAMTGLLLLYLLGAHRRSQSHA